MLHDADGGAQRPSAPADPVLVRAAGTATVDNASVVALGADGAIVGRATRSRLYGARCEVALQLAPTDAIAIALIEAVEVDARARGLAYLELDPSDLSDRMIETLRRSRPMREEHRGTHPHLIWPTTEPLVIP